MNEMTHSMPYSRCSSGPWHPAVARCTRRSRWVRWAWVAAALAVVGIQPLRAAAPANDSLAGALRLVGSTNTVNGTNVGATSEVGEPGHAGSSAATSVWWTWLAPGSGPVVLDTAGSDFDTRLAVYTGDAVNALTEIAANDDEPGLGTSRVAFPAIAGTVYRIAVDGLSGATGSVTLTLQLPLAPTPPSIISQPASRSVADNAGSNVTFTVVVTGSFPRFYEWQKNGIALAGGPRPSFTVTNATFATAGDYRVIVTNDYGSVTSSVAVLTVLARLPQDAFAGGVTIAGQTNTVTGHNYGATTEPGEPLHASVASGASLWWSWTAPQSGLVHLDTAGSTTDLGAVLDTVLGVYVGTSVNALTPVAANNDEVAGLLRSSKVVFRAAAGTTYQIAVAGFRDANGAVAVGNITLNLAQAPDNDHFANALIFPSGETQVRDNNIGATAELGEPPHAVKGAGKSVWWAWVAPSNGTYSLDTLGSSIDTVLAVYTGTAIGALTVVAEDDNRSDAGASLVRFSAVGGMAYRFAVDSHLGTNGSIAGDIVLTLNQVLGQNDNFADRLTLAGQTNQVSASSVGASKEQGEPNHAGNAGDRSLWWTWTAPITAPVQVTTRNSTFDTALAVYSGTSLTSLTLIAENEDTDPANPTAGSTVIFLGVQGETYQIAVDGHRFPDGGVAEGMVVLRVVQARPPAVGENDLFANRFTITGQSNTVVGVNTNASKEAGEPNHSRSRGGRSVWWSWVAPVSAPVTLKTLGSNFETLLGVYVGTAVSNLTEIANVTRSYGEGRSIVTFEAVQGVEYQFAVDGYNNGLGAASGQVVLNLFQHTTEPLGANDSFESAPPVSARFLTASSANIGAGRESGEPAHAGLQQGHSMWWTWTALADGPVTISTAGSQFDTTLSVYTGTNVASLVLVTENDDISASILQSSVRFQAFAGTVYRIAVDGYGNSIGFITLTVSPETDVPAAPQIAQAPADQTRFLSGGGGGTNAEFRVEAIGSPPLSYQWLFNGTNLPGATTAVFTVTNVTAADTGTYQVAVSNAFGHVTSSGAELALVAAPFNDSFDSRIFLTGISNAARGSILGARIDTNAIRRGVVWWHWTAPSNGPVEIHTVGSRFDTLLVVTTNTPSGAQKMAVANDDFLGEAGAGPSRIVFNAEAGQEYGIAVSGYKTNYTAGGVRLTLQQPPAPPLIVEQPRSLNVVSVTNTAFTLGVKAEGLTALFKYQWLFNGSAIPNATNASHTLGALSRTNSGRYAVTITNDFGSVTSSNSDVWVQVPQRLLSPQRLPDGRVNLFFSDPDGTLSSNPSRFEVHHTLNPSGSTTVWVTNTGGITINGGLFLYEDQTSGSVSRRTYRIIEK